MFQSIRWRVALPFSLLIAVVMLGLSTYLWGFVRQTYLGDLENKLVSQARLMGTKLAPLLAAGGDPQTLDPLAKHWGNLLGERVTIISAQGIVLGESHEDRSKMENHLSRPEIVQAAQSGQGSATRASRTVGYDMLYTAVAVSQAGKTVGFVRVALALQGVQTNLDHIRNMLLSVTLVTLILAIGLATWIASRTTFPLRQLTEAAGLMAQGKLETRLIPITQDEVGLLTHTFNLMAAQLQAQIENLESERSKMAAVLEEMSDGVVIVNPHGQIELINPAAKNMFEIQHTEACGHSVAEALRHHQLVDLWQGCQERGGTHAATIEIPGKRLYLEAIATPLGPALPGSILLLIQNLTRLRHLETVRRDFISNISHELRTPLASLKALTETLQAGALEDRQAAHHFLELMETEVDALSLMVSELLELSRIESGRVPLQLKASSVCEFVYPAVERLGLQAERAHLHLNVHCPDDLPDVLADPARMEQVMVNLLHNAIKFTSAGGFIDIHAKIEGSSLIISVTDSGVGIPAADLPRIFERFYKADRARSSGGTGLGLAIARHLVEAHGGRIWAESSENKGSTFSFTLPLTTYE